MWTPEHRQTHDRKGLRYPSDLTDAEWALVAPLIPPARRGGRRREVHMREVLNAVFYVLRYANEISRGRDPIVPDVPDRCVGGSRKWLQKSQLAGTPRTVSAKGEH